MVELKSTLITLFVVLVYLACFADINASTPTPKPSTNSTSTPTNKTDNGNSSSSSGNSTVSPTQSTNKTGNGTDSSKGNTTTTTEPAKQGCTMAQIDVNGTCITLSTLVIVKNIIFLNETYKAGYVNKTSADFKTFAELIEPQIKRELMNKTKTIHSVTLDKLEKDGDNLKVTVQVQLKEVNGDKGSQFDIQEYIKDALEADSFNGVKSYNDSVVGVSAFNPCKNNPCQSITNTTCNKKGADYYCTCNQAGYVIVNGTCVKPEPPATQAPSTVTSTKSTSTSTESGKEVEKSPCDDAKCGENFMCMVVMNKAQCSCKTGFYHYKKNGSCLAVDKLVTIDGFSLINETYKEEYKNSSSKEYMDLTSLVEPSILDSLQKVSQAVFFVETKNITKKEKDLVFSFTVALKGKNFPTNKALGDALKTSVVKNKTVNKNAVIESKELDYCETNPNVCGGWGVCQANGSMAYTCKCNENYEFKSGTCQEIKVEDPCESHKCSKANQKCMLKNNMPKCFCKEGYYQDKYTEACTLTDKFLTVGKLRIFNTTYLENFGNKSSTDFVNFEKKTTPQVLNALKSNLPNVAAVEIASISKERTNSSDNLLIDFLIIIEKTGKSPTSENVQKFFMDHVMNGTFKNMSADPKSSIKAVVQHPCDAGTVKCMDNSECTKVNETYRCDCNLNYELKSGMCMKKKEIVTTEPPVTTTPVPAECKAKEKQCPSGVDGMCVVVKAKAYCRCKGKAIYNETSNTCQKGTNAVEVSALKFTGETYNAKYADPNSPEFLEKAMSLEKKLCDAIKPTNPTVTGVRIKSMRQGSIVVDFIVVTESADNKTATPNEITSTLRQKQSALGAETTNVNTHHCQTVSGSGCSSYTYQKCNTLVCPSGGTSYCVDLSDRGICRCNKGLYLSADQCLVGEEIYHLQNVKYVEATMTQFTNNTKGFVDAALSIENKISTLLKTKLSSNQRSLFRGVQLLEVSNPAQHMKLLVMFKSSSSGVTLPTVNEMKTYITNEYNGTLKNVVNVTSLSTDVVGACTLYGRACGDYGDCIDRLNETSIAAGNTQCKCKADAEMDDGICKEDDQLVLKIVLPIVIILAIIIFIVVFYFCYYKKQKEDRKGVSKKNQIDPMDDVEMS